MEKKQSIIELLTEQDWENIRKRRNRGESYQRILDNLKHTRRDDLRLMEALQPMKLPNFIRYVKDWAEKRWIAGISGTGATNQYNPADDFNLSNPSAITPIAEYLREAILKDLEEQSVKIRDYEDILKYSKMPMGEVAKLSPGERGKALRTLDLGETLNLADIVMPAIPGQGCDLTVLLPIGYTNAIQPNSTPSSALMLSTTMSLQRYFSHSIPALPRRLVEPFGKLARLNTQGPSVDYDKLSELVTREFNSEYPGVHVRFIQHHPIILFGA